MTDKQRIKQLKHHLKKMGLSHNAWRLEIIKPILVLVASQFKEIRDEEENRTNIYLKANHLTHKEALKQQRESIIEMLVDLRKTVEVMLKMGKMADEAWLDTIPDDIDQAIQNVREM